MWTSVWLPISLTIITLALWYVPLGREGGHGISMMVIRPEYLVYLWALIWLVWAVIRFST